jgi:hypothetical protein
MREHIAFAVLACCFAACQPWSYGASSVVPPAATPTPFEPANQRALSGLTIHNGWPLTPIMLYQSGCKAFRLPDPPNVARGGYPGDRITLSRINACAATLWAATLPRDIVMCVVSVDANGLAALVYRGVDTDCRVHRSVWNYNLKRKFRPKGHTISARF